jgi:hypothetical protein
VAVFYPLGYPTPNGPEQVQVGTWGADAVVEEAGKAAEKDAEEVDGFTEAKKSSSLVMRSCMKVMRSCVKRQRGG